jgi:hypothetical protein
MLRKLLVVAVILGLGFYGKQVFAADSAIKTPGVAKRQHKQLNRIKQGVKSGELTRSEAKELIQDRKEIQQEKKEAKSDGVVTKEERKELQEKLNQESQKIYQEKHDQEKK